METVQEVIKIIDKFSEEERTIIFNHLLSKPSIRLCHQGYNQQEFVEDLPPLSDYKEPFN